MSFLSSLLISFSLSLMFDLLMSFFINVLCIVSLGMYLCMFIYQFRPSFVSVYTYFGYVCFPLFCYSCVYFVISLVLYVSILYLQIDSFRCCLSCFISLCLYSVRSGLSLLCICLFRYFFHYSFGQLFSSLVISLVRHLRVSLCVFVRSFLRSFFLDFFISIVMQVVILWFLYCGLYLFPYLCIYHFRVVSFLSVCISLFIYRVPPLCLSLLSLISS